MPDTANPISRNVIDYVSCCLMINSIMENIINKDCVEARDIQAFYDAQHDLEKIAHEIFWARVDWNPFSDWFFLKTLTEFRKEIAYTAYSRMVRMQMLRLDSSPEAGMKMFEKEKQAIKHHLKPAVIEYNRMKSRSADLYALGTHAAFIEALEQQEPDLSRKFRGLVETMHGKPTIDELPQRDLMFILNVEDASAVNKFKKFRLSSDDILMQAMRAREAELN